MMDLILRHRNHIESYRCIVRIISIPFHIIQGYPADLTLFDRCYRASGDPYLLLLRYFTSTNIRYPSFDTIRSISRMRPGNFSQVSGNLHLSDMMQPSLHILFPFFLYYNGRYSCSPFSVYLLFFPEMCDKRSLWISHGPSNFNASICSLDPYPLFFANPYPG